MKKPLIFILIAATMYGCGIYTNYKQPNNLPIDNKLYRVDIAEQDTTSIAHLSWKELFTDTKLQNLIEKGLQHNTDLKIAHLKITEMEASLLASRLAFLPSVSLTPQGSLSGFNGNDVAKSYSLGASASWELDIFGKYRNAKEGSKAALEQSIAFQQAVQTQLIATISNSYYTLLMLDKQLAISERTLSYWEDHVRTMKALKNAGQANEQAVAQSEANKISVEASVLNIRKQISKVENSLCALLGSTPFEIERGALDEQSFSAELSVGLPLQLLANRPDVRQAEAVLAQRFYATNQARSYFYPSITLSGAIGWSNNSGMGIVNPGKFLWNVLGSLVEPLFNRGTNIARLRITKAQQEEALLSFQQSLLNAGTEVNDALMQCQTARERQVLNDLQIQSLQSALRSTELTIRYGNATYLEVLTAQQSLLQAELTQAQDRFDEIQGIINLYHALGGGKF